MNVRGRPRAAVLALAVVVALAAGPGVAGAGLHSNHLTVDAQMSANGTVVIENGFAAGETLMVIHADAGGEPGEAVGVAPFPRPGEFVSPLTVSLDAGTWSDLQGSGTYWAVLHNDADNDGEYDPGSDDALTNFGSLAGDRFVLGKGDSPSYVVAQGFGAQESADGSVTVPRVALPEDGHLVVRTQGDDGPGAVVATKTLGAGVHEDVTVSLDPAFFNEQGERFALHAQAYTGSGGSAGIGSPVTAGDATVGTKFFVSKPAGASADGNASTNGSAGANGADGTDDGPAVNTPEGPAVNTPNATSTPTPTSGATDADPGSATATASPADATSADGPGFGVVLSLAALLAAAVALARRAG